MHVILCLAAPHASPNRRNLDKEVPTNRFFGAHRAAGIPKPAASKRAATGSYLQKLPQTVIDHALIVTKNIIHSIINWFMYTFPRLNFLKGVAIYLHTVLEKLFYALRQTVNQLSGIDILKPFAYVLDSLKAPDA